MNGYVQYWSGLVPSRESTRTSNCLSPVLGRSLCRRLLCHPLIPPPLPVISTFLLSHTRILAIESTPTCRIKMKQR